LFQTPRQKIAKLSDLAKAFVKSVGKPWPLSPALCMPSTVTQPSKVGLVEPYFSLLLVGSLPANFIQEHISTQHFLYGFSICDEFFV